MIQRVPELWPFSERNGSNLDNTIASLQAEPEIIWNGAEKVQLEAFSERLFTGESGQQVLPSLYEVSLLKADNDIMEIYDSYLVTDDGAQLAKSLGLGNGSTANGSLSVLRAKIAFDQPLDRPGLRDLAAKSRDWQVSQLQAAVNTETDESTALAVTGVNFAPARLLTKLQQLQAYRQLYRREQVSLKLAEDDPRLIGARQVLLNQHIAKVNAMTALLYPRAVQLAEQLRRSPASPLVRQWQRELYAGLPLIERGFKWSTQTDRQEFATNLLRRLDLVRNGAAPAAGAGHDYVPINPELVALADELDGNNQMSLETPPAVVSPVVLERLRATRWDSGQCKKFAEAVLQYYDLLSIHQTDADQLSQRTGPADDGKWQVVITDNVNNLTTESRTKTWLVPAHLSRTLIQVSPAGILPGTAHELEHVFQDEFAEQLAQVLPLAKIKGRRNVTSREMRAIVVEREFQALVGQGRPVNTMYLRAIQQKLVDAAPSKVVKAYLQAVPGVDQLKPSQRQARAKTAAGSVLRLYRHGGQNSQPLDYLEQELLARELATLSPETAQRVSLAAGSFALKDVAELYRHGLLPLPETDQQNLARDVLSIFMEQFYDNLTGPTAN